MRESFNVEAVETKRFQLQTIERFVRGDDAAFCQILKLLCPHFIIIIIIIIIIIAILQLYVYC